MFFDIQASRRAKQRCHRIFYSEWHRLSGLEICDRLHDVKRDFTSALEIGAQAGVMRSLITSDSTLVKKIRYMNTCGWHPDLLQSGDICIDENPEKWPFVPQSFDLVLSNTILHGLEDPLTHMMACRTLLKPDGLFLGILPGENHLSNVGQALIEAEVAVSAVVSPRMHPRTTMVDLGNMLGKVGFVLPILERIEHNLDVTNVIDLARHLRACGEGNTLTARRKTFTRRAVFDTWQSKLEEQTVRAAGSGTARHATTTRFKAEVIIFLAWTPGAKQPKALFPGSARHSFAESIANPVKSGSET